MGNPYAIAAGVVGAAESEIGKPAVEVAARHCSAQNEVMATPGVVAAGVGIDAESATEIGQCEGRYLRSDTERLGRFVECSQRGSKLVKAIALRL